MTWVHKKRRPVSFTATTGVDRKGDLNCDGPARPPGKTASPCELPGEISPGKNTGSCNGKVCPTGGGGIGWGQGPEDAFPTHKNPREEGRKPGMIATSLWQGRPRH